MGGGRGREDHVEGGYHEGGIEDHVEGEEKTMWRGGGGGWRRPCGGREEKTMWRGEKTMWRGGGEDHVEGGGEDHVEGGGGGEDHWYISKL